MDQQAEMRRRLRARGYRQREDGRTRYQIVVAPAQAPVYVISFYYPDEPQRPLSGTYEEILDQIAALPIRGG